MDMGPRFRSMGLGMEFPDRVWWPSVPHPVCRDYRGLSFCKSTTGTEGAVGMDGLILFGARPGFINPGRDSTGVVLRRPTRMLLAGVQLLTNRARES